MLKVAHLTKRRDACYWLRCLTPSGMLNSIGHKVQSELFEQNLFCHACQKGVIEFQWGTTEAEFKCPDCSAVLMDAESKKNWHQQIDRIIEESDVICFQRPTSIEALNLMIHAKSRGKVVTQVCDDNYLDVPEWNTGYKYYTARRKLIEETLKVCDSLDVTVPYLAERYKDYCKDIEVLPNCHDMAMLDLAPVITGLDCFDGKGVRHSFEHFQNARQGKRVILWGGSPTHEKDLELVVTACRRISRQENVVFAFVGYIHRALVEVLPKDRLFLFSLVSNMQYFSLMKTISAEVGLAPAAAHPFNLGKSNLRVLEYCFLRTYPVASNYPTYAGSAPQAVYANDEYGWFVGMRKAAGMDEDEMKAAADENRAYAEVNYDISTQIHRWVDYYTRLSNREIRK